MKLSIRSAMLAASVLAAIHAIPAKAADVSAPSGVVSLTASATTDIAQDLMSVTLSTTREGTDATSVQSGLKQALDAALNEARKAARPGQLDVHTGNFSLYPRYGNKGLLTGWQGRAELVVEGKDMPAIGQLTGRINTLTIARVGYSLSRELREKSEADVTGQAISRYRAKASDYARQFGYSGYTIREVNVSANEPPINRVYLQTAKAMSASADESLPVEAGKATVMVTVSGAVQMN